jgi:hypothetical protein
MLAYLNAVYLRQNFSFNLLPIETHFKIDIKHPQHVITFQIVIYIQNVSSYLNPLTEKNDVKNIIQRDSEIY